MSCRREEWIASLLAGAGSAWFLAVLSRSYHLMIQVLPPTGGPTEAIGIAVLIWLHAKHRRDIERRTPVFAELPDAGLSSPNEVAQ